MSSKINTLLKGIAAASGITIGNAFIFSKEKEEISHESIDNVTEAIKHLEDALALSKKELKKVFSLAIDKLGEKRASIFEAQMMILDDPVLIDNLKGRIRREKKLPEYIVDDEISKYIHLMNEAHEMYMKERSLDIEDIKNRIIRNLKKKKWKSKISSDVIVVTTTISPSDTVLFTQANVKGYVTDFGGLTSHAAIVARSLNIPAVLGVNEATSIIKDGDVLIVDGFHGEVIINPDEERILIYKNKINELNLYDEKLFKLRNKPAETIEGKEICLRANLDLTKEMDLIFRNNPKGIGLVRTEQIFEEYEAFPDEDEQFEVYNSIAQKIYPENVTIRAFDIGGDKVLPVDLHESNPFLGWRGIRLLLDNKNLFKSQIRAVLRASQNKNIKLMIPMVTSIEEVFETKELIDQCKKELKKEKKSFDNDMHFGIMIEIPSAAVLTATFAREVDFISIGTNDLIQYLLAVDRGNEIVSKLYQEFHPAVIRTLSHIIKEGKANDCKVSLCGEMGGDPLALPLLIGLGLEILSVSPSIVPLVKSIIRKLKYKDTLLLADKCLTYSTEKEIINELNLFYNSIIDN
ncbi:MAG: phosphoenolpyruvate--protein phosphotransferase [Melioribacteraceae bacterium]|nr:phosphoenolpyruvate--protein phosphotransferase [Melioribacteraceae bacterium]